MISLSHHGKSVNHRIGPGGHLKILHLCILHLLVAGVLLQCYGKTKSLEVDGHISGVINRIL